MMISRREYLDLEVLYRLFGLKEIKYDDEINCFIDKACYKIGEEEGKFILKTPKKYFPSLRKGKVYYVEDLLYRTSFENEI